MSVVCNGTFPSLDIIMHFYVPTFRLSSGAGPKGNLVYPIQCLSLHIHWRDCYIQFWEVLLCLSREKVSWFKLGISMPKKNPLLWPYLDTYLATCIGHGFIHCSLVESIRVHIHKLLFFKSLSNAVVSELVLTTKQQWNKKLTLKVLHCIVFFYFQCNQEGHTGWKTSLHFVLLWTCNQWAV